MNSTVVFWLLTSIFFEVIGDIAVKKATMDGGLFMWGTCFVAYNLMLVAWYVAVANAKLIALPGIIWMMCGQVALVLVGCGMFHEKLTTPQIAGAVLAAVALVLLSL